MENNLENPQNQEPEVKEPEVNEPETKKAEEPKEDLKVKYALQLFEALEDPNLAPHVVKSMAERLGLIGKQEQQQEPPKIKTVKQVLSERLGDDTFANELGEALQQVLDEKEKQLRKEFMEIESKRQAVEFEREYAKAITDLEITEEEAGALIELVDKFPYTGKQPVYDYLNELVEYHRTKVSKQKTLEDKRRQNAAKKPKTIASAANEENFNAMKIKSAQDAVMYALKEIQKGE